MARNDQQLIDMGTKALMKAGLRGTPKNGNKMGMEPVDEFQKLFQPKNGGKKKLAKKFDIGKAGKKKIKKVKGYQYAGEVESDHPSQWYAKGKKKA